MVVEAGALLIVFTKVTGDFARRIALLLLHVKLLHWIVHQSSLVENLWKCPRDLTGHAYFLSNTMVYGIGNVKTQKIMVELDGVRLIQFLVGKHRTDGDTARQIVQATMMTLAMELFVVFQVKNVSMDNANVVLHVPVSLILLDAFATPITAFANALPPKMLARMTYLNVTQFLENALNVLEQTDVAQRIINVMLEKETAIETEIAKKD